jgi:ABC-2 type transport system permease protein
MRIFDLAGKDLLQLLRDWKAAIFLILMPIVFTIFFGFVFGDTGNPEDTRLAVGVVDLDPGGPLGATLVAMLEQSESIRIEMRPDTTLAGANTLVADEKLVAAIIIPAGYSASALAGDAIALTVILDEQSVDGQMLRPLLQTVVTRLAGTARVALLSAETYASEAGFADEPARQAYLEEALSIALDAWKAPALTVSVEQAAVEASDESLSPFGDNVFAHSSPGMMIQFAIVGLIGSAEMLMAERKTRALRRLFTTPARRIEILFGHLLAMFAVVFLQLAILVVFGNIALGLNYFRTPAATLLLTTMLALWAATLGLLIGVLARSSEQVTVFALIPMFVFSALGGAWMPLEFTSRTFSAIGYLTPTAWAIDGFKNLIIRGQGLESILTPAAILLGWSAFFLILSAWRFRPE